MCGESRCGLVGLFGVALLACGCPPGVDYCADHDARDPIPDEWQVIGAGSFEMGSDEGDAREQPVHTVAVNSFLIGRTEVTVAQYAQCYCAGVCEEPYIDAEPVVQNWAVAGRDQHPVNYTNWHHASTYCAWVEGRLPTEAEWEYAARSAGQPIAFAWGDEWASCDRAVMDDEDHTAGCDEGRTWEVCSRPDGTSDQDLCDMAGNVWEWVRDEYHGNYNGATIDGSAWDDAAGSTGILRGGSFADDDGQYLRAAFRNPTDPDDGTYTAGFRCAR